MPFDMELRIYAVYRLRLGRVDLETRVGAVHSEYT
jgi:hypothetical protein